jgi:hypothetical protein
MSEIADKPEGQTMAETQAMMAADPAYTIKPSRLRGSPSCLNCGTPLQGPFCHYCGQPDRNFLRFFPALLRELASDFLDFDSRFMRTMKPLLFHPGRLTRDFLAGRRYRYTPPLRLYLFASIVFFLFAALISNNVVEINKPQDGQPDEAAGAGSRMSEEELAELDKALEVLPADLREQVRMHASESAPKAPEEDLGFQVNNLQFNDQPWDRETNPLVVPFFPQSLDDWVNDEIAESPRKAEAINANPSVIIDQVFDLLPGTMFVLLPVVALIFKFWYLFARRYYIEHLVFALHNHAFIYVTLLLALLLGLVGDALAARGWTRTGAAVDWVDIALFVWIPLYLLVSLRTVYRQGWFLTLCKFALIGLSYLTLLGLVTSFVAVLGFLLL